MKSLLEPPSFNDKADSAVQNPTHEIIFKCKRKESTLHIKYYPTDPERRELIRTLGEAACILFEHYLRRAGQAGKGDTEEMTDQAVAQQFGWSKQKAQRLRLGLTNAGWFRPLRFTYSDGRKGTTYYVGKEAVQESLGKTK